VAVFFSDIYEVIDNLDVSFRWKQIFKKIYTVYYQNFSEGKASNQHFWQPSPLISVLGIGDKWKFHCLFNFWALIFGPFYYIAKGLVAKGLILLVIYAISIFAVAMLPVMGNTTVFLLPLINFYCAILFNADYFLEKVVRSAAVKKEPRLFGDYVNEAYFSRVADNPKANLIEPIMATLVTIIITGICSVIIYIDTVAILAVGGTQFPPVCQDPTSCSEKIMSGGASHYNLAYAHSTSRDWDNAIKEANLAVKENPGNISAWILLGNMRFNKQKYMGPGGAIEAYQKALNINPRIQNINFNIGRCYYRQRDYVKALDYFQKATRKYPCFLFPQYYELQGYTKVLLGDKLGGARDLKAAIRNYEKFPEGPARIGLIEQYLKTNGL